MREGESWFSCGSVLSAHVAARALRWPGADGEMSSRAAGASTAANGGGRQRLLHGLMIVGVALVLDTVGKNSGWGQIVASSAGWTGRGDEFAGTLDIGAAWHCKGLCIVYCYEIYIDWLAVEYVTVPWSRRNVGCCLTVYYCVVMDGEALGGRGGAQAAYKLWKLIITIQ